MLQWKNACCPAALGLLMLALALMGCAASQAAAPQKSQPELLPSPLYMLTTAGFQPWGINMETPKRAALMDAIPKGKIVTYEINGSPYHVYADPDANILYVGDELAYQRYLGMTKGKSYCERVTGANQEQFWRCFEEFQEKGAHPPGR
jgi:hypothetical protein